MRTILKVGTVVRYLADAKQECRHQLKKSLNVLQGGINASASLEGICNGSDPCST